MVLGWRNAAHVRANSLDDRVIEASAHERFVESLTPESGRRYFVVHVDGTASAVMNVDVQGREGRWGCYLGGDPRDLRPGLFPLLVGLSGALAFGPFDCRMLRSEVLAHNLAPQRLNAHVGIAESARWSHERTTGESVPVVGYEVARREWPGVKRRVRSLLTSALRETLDAFGRDPLAHVG